MRETQVQALGWEDPLEKEMAAHSSSLAWKIPWTECPWDRRESDKTQRLHLPFFTILMGGERCPPTPSRVFFFFFFWLVVVFTFFGLDITQRPISYSQTVWRTILMECSCFSEGGWMERCYPALTVAF